MNNNNPHDGYNIKRIREILGIKQDKIAAELGGKWNQQRVSVLEKKATINPELLERIAKAMNVTVHTVKVFNDEIIAKLISILTNDGDLINAGPILTNPSVNPVDKMVELYERIIREKDGEIEDLKSALRRARSP